MAGLAPRLSLLDDDTAEGARKQLREWALKSYVQAADPEREYLLQREGQPLVDAAYVAGAFCAVMSPCGCRRQSGRCRVTSKSSPAAP